MPPPTVVCKICKQQVLKAQTYHIGNGERACKAHEGVVDQKDKLLLQEKLHKEAEELRKKKEEEERRQEREDFSLQPRCWFCGKKGIDSRVFYRNLLIHKKVHELKGNNINWFSNELSEIARKANDIGPDETFLVITHTSVPEERKLEIEKLLKRQSVPAYQIMGRSVVGACQHCMVKHKIESPTANVPLDKMMLIGSMVDSVVTEQAKALLAQESTKN